MKLFHILASQRSNLWKGFWCSFATNTALLLSFSLFSLDYTLVTKIINREQKLGYYQQHGADKSKHLYQI